VKNNNGSENKSRVGIPRALLYHKYGKLWEVFFRELGVRVVLSPETNKEIVARGARLSIDESCLSVKIFIGHIDWLKDKTDLIFVPNIVCLRRNEEMCSKFMALVDISRNTFRDCQFIDYTVDVAKFKNEFFGLMAAGLRFSRNPAKLILAYVKAKLAWRRRAKDEKNDQAVEFEKIKKSGGLSILIASHAYTIRDNFLGKPILDFLKKSGGRILYSDRIDDRFAADLSAAVSKTLYWSYHKQMLGAVEFYKNHVDGIIFITTFPCGPDALAISLCRGKLRDVPAIIITLDELESRVGLQTRLESFVDIINIRKCKTKK